MIINEEAKELPKMSFFDNVKVAAIAGFILSMGFMSSILVLTLSFIMLPFVAIKMWFLQKKVKEATQAQAQEPEANQAPDSA